MGAFGWCLSQADGRQLATGMGPAQSMAPSSYQAKGYGMLVILWFLVQICEFCGSAPLGSTMYCDNQALVNPIAKRLCCTRWYPNKMISSDWDIIQAIISTLAIFTICPDIHHVKGHQDTQTPYARLSLEVQLNVDADAAASEFQDTFGGIWWQVPRISRNLAQLSLAHKTVTHHYLKHIRQAYCHPLSWSYIGKCNPWSSDTLVMVNWKGLGTACNRYHNQRPYVVELNHDILPT
jgi:hypothetical protein